MRYTSLYIGDVAKCPSLLNAQPQPHPGAEGRRKAPAKSPGLFVSLGELTLPAVATDIQLVLAEMQRANALTAELVAAQLITQAAQEQTAIDARKTADYAEQRLAVERGFFMDVGSLLIEVREQKELMRAILTQTPLSGALQEFTEQAHAAGEVIERQLEIVLRFMQTALPYLSGTMAKADRGDLSRQLAEAVHAPRLAALQAQCKEWQSALDKLKEQEAVYGGVPPVELLTRIERAKGRVTEIAEEMQALERLTAKAG